MEGPISPCFDCGKNTTPPRSFTWEWYMVENSVWEAAGMPADTSAAPPAGADHKHGFFLCVACIEKRLGRPLAPDDFTDAPVNDPMVFDDSPLMFRRKVDLSVERLFGRR